MHAQELLDDGVYFIESVFDLVVCISWWKFEFQDESIQLVKHDDEGNVLADRLSD